MQKLDFDIGNLLYIIITLVVVLVGVLGKKKKPGSPGGSSGSKSQPGFLENLEKLLTAGQEPMQVSEYQEDDEEIIPVSEVVYESRKEPVKEPVSHSTLMDDYDRIMQGYTHEESSLSIPETDDMNQPLEVIELDEDTGTDFFEMIKKFDARTAIVYSAIINPLDY